MDNIIKNTRSALFLLLLAFLSNKLFATKTNLDIKAYGDFDTFLKAEGTNYTVLFNSPLKEDPESIKDFKLDGKDSYKVVYTVRDEKGKVLEQVLNFGPSEKTGFTFNAQKRLEEAPCLDGSKTAKSFAFEVPALTATLHDLFGKTKIERVNALQEFESAKKGNFAKTFITRAWISFPKEYDKGYSRKNILF